MFGYVVVNKPELKIREFDTYNAYYCGLCRALKERHGFFGQATLNYDMTMVVLLLTGLYEPETTEKRFRCLVHPRGRHIAKVNSYSSYAGDMNVFLAYEKAMDDVRDERKLSSWLLALTLKKKAQRVRDRYPKKTAAIAASLRELMALEKQGEQDLDTVAACFGRIMAEVCCCQQDIWADTLKRFGFFLGKFIYLLDAYDDLQHDEKKGCYNPLLSRKDNPRFEENIHEILEMMMAEAAKAFEILPIVENAELLRNILYAGVWTRYLAKREKEQNAK